MTDTQNRTTRCGWLDQSKPDYVAYHDTEWGVPVRDDQRQFEFLTLESAQAGLSWYTVLRKRAGYRRIFHGFDPQRVASMGEDEILAALQDPAIVRNQAKVRAAVSNAACFVNVQAEYGSFCDYLWGFVDGTPVQNRWATVADVPATTSLSDRVSKDLKQRGFKFVGSTIVYAHLQAAGLINDHTTDCFRWQPVHDMGAG